MPEYKTVKYDDVNNPQYSFYKLIIDGVCHFDEFLQGIDKNSADRKVYNAIIRYMDSITDQIRLPRTKFRQIEDSGRSDLFEFKKDRIRIYVIKQRPNFFIVIGGFKSSQTKDIKKFKVLIKDFPKQI